MKVFEPKGKVRYATLSYMWPLGEDNDAKLETGNLNALETPGGLVELSLPAIVSDAMGLCNQLDENYLWIDRLCIVQDDEASKYDQIRAMDKIYRSAAFCIVAALNNRDGRGLPGLRSRQRPPSATFPARKTEIEGGGIEPNGMVTMVEDSLWNKRGWTFQERVLSRRRLYVTEYQVIFECARGLAYEEMTYCTPRPMAPPNEYDLADAGRMKERELEEKEHEEMPSFTQRSRYMPGAGLNLNMTESLAVTDYFTWVENYTARQLTVGTDILNAFAGVGSALGESLNTSMIFGLPEKYLPQALMWSTSGASEPRQETTHLPSWSWASTKSLVDYYWLKGSSVFKDDLLKIATVVFFHYQDPDKGLRKLDVGERWIQHEISLADALSGPELPELQAKCKPGAWRTRMTWQECPHNPWQSLAWAGLNPEACTAAENMPGALLFNTTVASLRIGHHFKYEKTDQHLLDRDAAIFDHTGEHIGQIHRMPLEWINEQASRGTFHEFVVVSGGLADTGARKMMAKYLNDFDMWRLQVMLVERLENEPTFVVRRKEVGYIRAHRWKFCNPRWETVVLV